MKATIPNLFTSANLVFGCLAIIEIFEGRLDHVVYYTLLSGSVDFFDGFLARRLNVASPIGKDLDSLADMVSFGVVSGLIMYKLMQGASTSSTLPLLGLLIIVISALRLAKFNNDQRQHNTFYGVPTPAIALFVGTLPLYQTEGLLTTILTNYNFLAVTTLVLSILMVINVPLLAFKFQDFSWQENKLRFLFVVVALGLFCYYQLLSLPMIIILYVLLSLVVYVLDNKKTNNV